ncbi:MAG: hypothetical protein JOZ87_23405, partial [Chloroflexi bacterium]|nr:hypothetical protein [Chloroflexota bacterium]
MLQLPRPAVTAAEQQFVARGRAIFAERFADADFSFGDPIWNVRVLETRRHQRTNASAYFTRQG